MNRILIKYFLRFILILTPYFSASFCWAETATLFTLYRTNYYPEKTYAYTLDYDAQSCRITSRQPISVYFISTASGAKLNGFSGYNREYFEAQGLTTAHAQNINFNFKAIRELESILNQSLQLRVTLNKSGNSCRVKTDFLANGRVLSSDLKKIDVEFNLKNRPPFGLQPESINWLKLLSHSNSRCLIGTCR